MKKYLLALSLVSCGILMATSSAALAAGPIVQVGNNGFRPAYLRSDGPQPFSTRRSRELQASRGQGIVNRALVVAGNSPRAKTAVGILQSAKRPAILRNLGSRLR